MPSLHFHFQVEHKGLISYRDPESAPGRGHRTLHVAADMDLTKMFVRAVRDSPSAGVQGLSGVEAHIRANFDVEVEGGVDFGDVLKKASKRALAKSLVTVSSDGKGFKAVNTNVVKKPDGTKQVK